EAVVPVRIDTLRDPGPDPGVYQGLDQISGDNHGACLIDLHHSPPLIDCAMIALILRSASLAADSTYFAWPSRGRQLRFSCWRTAYERLDTTAALGFPTEAGTTVRELRRSPRSRGVRATATDRRRSAPRLGPCTALHSSSCLTCGPLNFSDIVYLPQVKGNVRHSPGVVEVANTDDLGLPLELGSRPH